MAVPLITADHVLGCLTLGWRSDVSPTADQIRLAETLASYAATLVDSAQTRTQQRQSQVALEASETRYRQIVETAQEGIYISDAERTHHCLPTRSWPTWPAAPWNNSANPQCLTS